jgi:hypothetical protein
MNFLGELWVPIVLSAVIVWIASFLMHMVLPHHKGEWKGMSNEEGVLAALKDVPPGQYMFPWCDMKQMNDPAVQEKLNNNPNGTITIWAGRVNMGRNLLLTFATYLFIGAVVAYLSWHAMQGERVDYMDVFRISGTAAFLGHGLGWITHMIWYQVKGFWTHMFDSVVYALLTAGVFGWLWPT